MLMERRKKLFIWNPFNVEINPLDADSCVILSPTFCNRDVASDNFLASSNL